MKVVRTLFIAIAILGTIGLGLNVVFGIHTASYISEYTNGYQTFYVYDFENYLKNLEANITNYDKLALTMPNLQWNSIENGLISITNILLMVVNILLYPIRIGAYVINILLVIMGVDVQNPSTSIQWLTNFINQGISLQIRYISYI